MHHHRPCPWLPLGARARGCNPTRPSTCRITADRALGGLLHHIRPEGMRVLSHPERVRRVDGTACKVYLCTLEVAYSR